MNVVITGTSRGIGLELLRGALSAGHKVVAVARKSNQSDALTELVEKYSDQLKVLDCDVGNPEAGEQIADYVNAQMAKVDTLINNAGIFRKTDQLPDFMDSFRINTVAPFMLTQALLPALKKSERPCAIHITSKMGSIQDNSSGGYHSYRASKAALNMISKGFSIDVPWLTSVVVHPGWVKTDMGGSQAPLMPERSAEAIWALLKRIERKDSGKFFDYTGESIPW